MSLPRTGFGCTVTTDCRDDSCPASVRFTLSEGDRLGNLHLASPGTDQPRRPPSLYCPIVRCPVSCPATFTVSAQRLAQDARNSASTWLILPRWTIGVKSCCFVLGYARFAGRYRIRCRTENCAYWVWEFELRPGRGNIRLGPGERRCTRQRVCLPIDAWRPARYLPVPSRLYTYLLASHLTSVPLLDTI